MQLERDGADPQLEARIQSMEIAFRMQTEAPEAFDITQGARGDPRARTATAISAAAA